MLVGTVITPFTDVNSKPSTETLPLLSFIKPSFKSSISFFVSVICSPVKKTGPERPVKGSKVESVSWCDVVDDPESWGEIILQHTIKINAVLIPTSADRPFDLIIIAS